MVKNLHISKIASTFVARWKSLLGITGILLLSLLVVSCAEAGDGDGDTDDDTFAVGGTVSGLAESEEITLTLTPDGGTTDEKKVTGDADANTDDNFTFDTKLAKDAKYTITSTSPAGKLCTVEPAGEQTMGEGNVTTVKVTCVTETTEAQTYTISGAVSGLASGETITLTLTPAGETPENETITGDNDFDFDTELAKDAKYTITSTSPAGKLCIVEPAGEQTMGEGDVTTVKVTCVTETPVIQTFSIGGTISGHTDTVDLNLAYGSESENLPIAVGVTEFTFAKKLELSDTYTVSVATDPAGQTCTVSPAGPQTMLGDVTDITVTCVANTYFVGGIIRGLAENQQITLTLTTTGGTAENKQFNGDANTNFVDYTFDTLVAVGATYEVTVATQPYGKACIVLREGEHIMPDNIVKHITVGCSDIPTYSVGGSVSGLAENDEVILTLTPTGGTAEDETVTGDATATTDDAFTFDTKLAKDATYTVSVKTQPTGKTCTVDPATEQTMGEADVTIVKVTCVVTPAATYSIGGTSEGHQFGYTLNLAYGDSGSEDLFVAGEFTGSPQSFTFAKKLAEGDTYTVTVKFQPDFHECIIPAANAGEQTMGNADVSITMICTHD